MSFIVMEGSHGAGKSTIIKGMQDRYNLITLKSIPDWYRKYIPFARSLPPQIQKQVYMIGHEANYETLQKNKDYILDRFFYTTIIRLNYELGITPNESIKEMLSINMIPNIVFYLNANKEIVLKRLNTRGDICIFDEKFFKYENETYRQLSTVSDKIISVNNDNTIDETLDVIDNHLHNNKILLRRKNEKRI